MALLSQFSRPFILNFRPVNNASSNSLRFKHVYSRQVRYFPVNSRSCNLNKLNDRCCAARRWQWKTPWISTMFCDRRNSTNAEVFLQSSRAMSQLSKPDEDIDRMRRVLQHSGVSQGTSDTVGDRLLYEVRAIWMMRICTLLFYGTSLTGLYMAPDIISTALEHEGFNSQLIIESFGIFMGVVALPFLLTRFNRRLVLKMYYNQQRNSYSAMTMSVFLRMNRVEFLREDIVRPNQGNSILGYFNLTTVKAKGRPYFVNPYNFKLPSDYNRLMGYEKEL
ncbi:transmembrane protein 70 homolog, mitochondrial-like [Asterias amurensis]|uniref:transmembrane protein 70 homolog, mitochondrial-like n=1 Tax=Asterias amurensis TaxID=7602 RepID=UPI003AB909C5